MRADANKLLIDVGNSRIKYAWLDTQTSLSKVFWAKQTDTLLPLMTQAREVYLASVGQAKTTALIIQTAKQNKVPLLHTQTQPQQLGIRCAYSNHATLGIDRWMGILASRQRTQLPCAILSIGTAITCDFIDKDQHLGGWIAPGFDLMRNSLTTGTDQVFVDDTYPTSLNIGETTQSCVNHGCLAAIQGLYMQAHRQLQDLANNSASKAYRLFISGGGRSFLQAANLPTDQSLVFIDNSVIEGLAAIARCTDPV